MRYAVGRGAVGLHRQTRLQAVGAATLFLLLFSVGCRDKRVTHSHIEKWSGSSESGAAPPDPAALVRAIQTSKSVSLRGHALAALILTGGDGTKQAFHQFDEIQAGERDEVATEMVRWLGEAMAEAGVSPPGETSTAQVDQGPSYRAVFAKDALYRMRTKVSEQTAGEIDALLVRWVTGEIGIVLKTSGAAGEVDSSQDIQLLSRRMVSGVVSGRRILDDVGPGAAAALGDAIARLCDKSNRSGAGAELLWLLSKALGRVGSPEQRAVAADSLMIGSCGTSGETHLRWSSLGVLATPKTVQTLLEKLEKPPGVSQQTGFFLAALEAGSDSKALAPALEPALAIAADEATEPWIRDHAFSLLRKIGGKPVLDAIIRVGLLKNEREYVRFAAVELAVACGRQEALLPIFDALPVAPEYSPGELERYLFRYVRPLDGAARPAILAALRHRSWVARAAALELMVDLGQPEDAPEVRRLFGDNTKLRGWSGRATIGSLARRVADSLSHRP